MKLPKILFFIEGMSPTEKETEAALDIGAVAMRNRSLILPGDNPEACDAVAGENIPEPYKDKPVVKSLADAIKIVREKARAEHDAARATLANEAPAESVGKEGKSEKETPARKELGGRDPANKPNSEPAPAQANWKANA